MEVRMEAPYEEQQNSTEQKAKNWIQPAGEGRIVSEKSIRKQTSQNREERKKKKKQDEMKLTYLIIATKTKAPSQSHQPQQQ